jgi:hypothetical protein
MATNTAGTAARNLGKQLIHYLRKGIVFGDAATTVVVGVIPAGALILNAISGVVITTAFNAGTNNRLDIGASSDTGTNNYATLLALGTLGLVVFDEGAVLAGPVASDTTVSAYVDVTGNAATTGAAEIVVAYIPDNDL